MRIIFLGDSIYTQNTGIHYYGRQLVRKIINAYPSHEFMIIHPGKREKIIDIPKEPRLQHRVVPIIKYIPFHLRFRQIWTIPRLIRKLEPDVVIELAHFGPFFLSAGVKRISVIHDLTPVYFPAFHSKGSHLLHKWLIPGILKRADHIIVNSHTTRRDIQRFCDVDVSRIHVIYPEIEEPANAFSRQNPDLPPGVRVPYFLTVGTIEPRKDHQTILNAFEKFCEVDMEFQWVIAGKKGWKTTRFLNQLENSRFRDRITWCEYIPRRQLWELYQNAYALIQASVYEGFGLPVLEGMSCGLPMILSDCPSHKEVAGASALFFTVKAHEQLFQKMKELKDNAGIKEHLSQMAKTRFRELNDKTHDLDFIFAYE